MKVMLLSLIILGMIGCSGVGEDGKDGTNGVDGVNGIDGVSGVDGVDGLNGLDGNDGVDGKNYYKPNTFVSCSGLINEICYYNEIGLLHRDDGPAKIYYYDDGRISSFAWYINGVFIESNVITYRGDNDETVVTSWYVNGLLHRDDGPAQTIGNSIYWYREGKLHNTNGPAISTFTDDNVYGKTLFFKAWYIDGNLTPIFNGGPVETIYLDNEVQSEVYIIDNILITKHFSYRTTHSGIRVISCIGLSNNGVFSNPTEPSSICYHDNGEVRMERWEINGPLNNNHGPAISTFTDKGEKEIEWWYVNDKRHNASGPAIIQYNLDGTINLRKWYIDGIQLTEVEFNNL